MTVALAGKGLVCRVTGPDAQNRTSTQSRCEPEAAIVRAMTDQGEDPTEVALSRVVGENDRRLEAAVKRGLGLALVLVLFAMPVAAQKVQVDYDRDAINNDYKTFAWGETPEATLSDESPFMHSRIKNAIEHYLTIEASLTEDTENPDLYVTYHTSSKEEVQFYTTSVGYGYGPGWGWSPYWGGGMSTSTTSATTYERGTLVIDIWDAKKREIVWRGSASGVVKENPQKAAKQIDSALKKMIKQYDKMRKQDLK
jgi:hypothetical protein